MDDDFDKNIEWHYTILAALTAAAVLVIVGVLLDYKPAHPKPAPAITKTCVEQPRVERVLPSTWWDA